MQFRLLAWCGLVPFGRGAEVFVAPLTWLYPTLAHWKMYDD